MKKKILLVAALGLLVLIVAPLVALVVYVDHIAEQAIERGGTYALGVPTTLDSADVQLLGGSTRLTHLSIANPAGFTSDRFFGLGRGEAAVTLGSLRQDTVEVPHIYLDKVHMSLEKNKDGRANYSVILENLQKLKGQEQPGEQPPAEAQPGKKYVVREIVLRDIVVDVRVSPTLGELAHQEVRIPEIRLTDVGSDTDKGVVMSELTGVIVQAVMEAVVRSGVELPGKIVAELGKGLAELPQLAGGSLEVVGEASKVAVEAVNEAAKKAGEAVGEAARGVGKAAEDAGKAVEGAGKEAGKVVEGLGGLLGGKKKQESAEE